LVAREKKIMHRKLSKFAAVALVAAIALGAPALADLWSAESESSGVHWRR
jgi:hypothetical protein